LFTQSQFVIVFLQVSPEAGDTSFNQMHSLNSAWASIKLKFYLLKSSTSLY